MSNEKVGYMDYKNGTLFICNGDEKMFFPCNNKLAGRIMEAVREAHKNYMFDDFMDAPWSLNFVGTSFRDMRIAPPKVPGMWEGWEKIGHVDDMTLYVRCVKPTSKLFKFDYESDRFMQDTHGDHPIKITLDI